MSTFLLIAQVLDWLEDELELGEYRREFARAKVDGTLLLNLEVYLFATGSNGRPLSWRSVRRGKHVLFL